MTSDVDFDYLLHKYMFHVARLNQGETFVGVGHRMRGFTQEEIHALQRAASNVKHDKDLDDDMTPRATVDDDHIDME
ncbi:hypothetical protein [Shinella sp. M31]|uniref:hypothetical protein n=1 Tax=Shinella sp. M31 TaxID=3368615 RepID=UPI003BA23DA4